MSRIHVANEQKRPVDLQLIRRIVEAALRHQGQGKAEVSVVLVTASRMQELNQRYRGREYVTDVLAFPLGGEFVSTGNLLGDVVICVAKAVEAAEERGHSLDCEVSLLAAHGILHLAGYSDESVSERGRMRRAEREILAGLGLERIV